jgi:DNA-binding transcriptional MerR regulator
VSWSTRELAELAKTTVNTVRHYHAVGLLDMPDRGGNGYKRYGVRHLVRVLRLRRLVELGVPLAHIPLIDTEAAPEELQRMQDALGADIERLNATRRRLQALQSAGAPIDAPPGFEHVWNELSGGDRTLLQFLTRRLDGDPHALSDLARSVAAEPADLRRAFAQLAPDADDPARSCLAARLGAEGANWRTGRAASPLHPIARSRSHDPAALLAVQEAVYSVAQRDTLTRSLTPPVALERAG